VTKHGGHNNGEKLMLFDFITATQASQLCFRFYNALDTSDKKRKKGVTCWEKKLLFFPKSRGGGARKLFYFKCSIRL